VSSTYSDVDASADAAMAVEWQDRVDAWPQVRVYKRRIRELLAGAGRLLDVGCGPGGDVVALGADRCLGADRSAAMCTEAVARGATACQADAHRLPFPDGVFDGAFADRVLQHVDDPARALGEMARVVRRGGRVVVADPDQETLVIHLPGVRRELADRVKALRRDVGYRNGRLVSSLPAALPGLGIGEVAIDPFPVLRTDPDDTFGLPGWPRLWQARGGFSEEDILEWERGVERVRDGGGFVYCLIYFVISGVRQ
jgi:SAM-dependent methyltransferase